MRNLKLFLSIIITSITLNFSLAQDALAFVETPEEVIFSESIEAIDEVRIDKTGAAEISEYLSDHVSYPFVELNLVREIKVTVQVSLNAFGEVIDYRIVEATRENVGQNVLDVMANLKNVSPILFNGTPKAQTIQIPLIFKS